MDSVSAVDHHLDATSFETLARERVAEFAPDTDLDTLGVVFDLVRVANQLIGDLEGEVHRPSGWSWAGFRIMFTVLVAGPLEPRQVARLAGVTRASISAVLNTLERDGFVTRRRESEDRRVVTIVLTPKGRRAVMDAYRRHHEVERAWVAALSPSERTTLNRLLRKMLETRPDLDGN